MKIEYIRRLNASHMVVEQKKGMSQWELTMLEHNQIEGVMFAKEVSENRNDQLWYDITGKQALDIVLENGKLDYELLCRILTGILEVTNRLERLLLSADSLWLKPETIFVDCREETVSFCYYPGYEEKMHKTFEELVEYLLTKVWHKDEKAVELIYDLYEQTRKEGYSLSGLLQGIRVSYPREDAAIDRVGVDTMEQERASETLSSRMSVYQNASRHDMEQKGEKNYEIFTVKQRGRKVWERKHAMKKQRDKRNRESGGKVGKHKEMKLPWEMKYKSALWTTVCKVLQQYFGWDGNGKEKKKGFRKAKTEEENVFLFSPDDEKESSNLHPTVLLTEINKKTEGILCYEGEGEQPDFILDTFPFVIGSDKSCNGYLPDETVSRRHARVTKQEDIYFIEDLNSSNGTYVGGELLNYRVRMSLQKNELIMFADKKFRFI